MNWAEISQRDAFWGRVYELANNNHNIVVVSADMGAPALDQFRRNLPSQYVDVGIAEQQAIGVSAGLALGGKKVFVYAIAPFISLRCYEHIRVSLAMMNIPVTIVGAGAGLSHDDLGPTHHAVEDITALRALNIQINNITDSAMAVAAVDHSCSLNKPNYVRLDRQLLPQLYSYGSLGWCIDSHIMALSLSPHYGVGFVTLKPRFRPPRKYCILATGNMVHVALKVINRLDDQIEIGLIDCHQLPLSPALLDELKDVQTVFTMEEHTLPGGFGSAVCELVCDSGKNIRIKRFGLDFKDGYCYTYGGREHILRTLGLGVDTLVKSISEICC